MLRSLLVMFTLIAACAALPPEPAPTCVTDQWCETGVSAETCNMAGGTIHPECPFPETGCCTLETARVCWKYPGAVDKQVCEDDGGVWSE